MFFFCRIWSFFWPRYGKHVPQFSTRTDSYGPPQVVHCPNTKMLEILRRLLVMRSMWLKLLQIIGATLATLYKQCMSSVRYEVQKKRYTNMLIINYASVYPKFDRIFILCIKMKALPVLHMTWQIHPVDKSTFEWTFFITIFNIFWNGNGIPSILD